MREKGFISIILFFLLSAICVGAYLSWSSVVRYSELSYKKELYEKDLWLLCGALEYSSERIYKNSLLSDKGLIDLNNWPLGKKKDYKISVEYLKEKDTYKITARLERNSSVKKLISCIFVPDEKSNKKFFIKNWTEHVQNK